ncbi:hypothetical protein HDU97_008000 [Phlyctochytrium planicorne]|nr:hypothetical protein HDU97_008000 [Phlyctochytrium planicorne]
MSRPLSSHSTKDTGVQASRLDLEPEKPVANLPPYRELLNSAMEYVALFRVNRPAQSDSFSVKEVHNTEDIYHDLLQDRLRKAVKDKEEEYDKRMDQVDRDTFQMKKETHQRAYEVSKLRTHVARYQMLLRKHNITESDAYLTIDDERIKTEDFIEHYQTMLASKEAKTAELAQQLRQLEDFVDIYGLRNGKQSFHVRDLLDASGGDIESRRTSVAALDAPPKTAGSRPPMSARIGAAGARRPSITDSEAGGGSDFGSNMSLAMPANGSIASIATGRPPAPPSRAGQGRRTHFSDLGRVVERGGDSTQRVGSRPPTTSSQSQGRALRPVSVATEARSRQVSTNKDPSQELDLSRSIWGTMEVAEPTKADEVVLSDDLLSEEEAIMLAAQVKEQYEEKLRMMLDSIAAQIEEEKAEIIRINREFRERFEELQVEISKDGQIVERLSHKQPKIINLIHYIFPVGVKPNHANKGVQCDLDAETASQLRVPSPRKRTFSISH